MGIDEATSNVFGKLRILYVRKWESNFISKDISFNKT